MRPLRLLLATLVAHALFALLFLALLALAAWEAHIYFGWGNPADYFR